MPIGQKVQWASKLLLNHFVSVACLRLEQVCMHLALVRSIVPHQQKGCLSSAKLTTRLMRARNMAMMRRRQPQRSEVVESC